MNKIENILNDDLLNKLYEFSRNGENPSSANFFKWMPSVVGMSNPIFLFELTNELKDEITKTLVEKNIFKCYPKKVFMIIQLCSRNAFIPWHGDEGHLYSGTIYLNKQWDINHGGYFMYKKNDEIYCIKPEYNLGVFFTPPMDHSLSITSIDAPMRESLQIFVDEF